MVVQGSTDILSCRVLIQTTFVFLACAVCWGRSHCSWPQSTHRKGASPGKGLEFIVIQDSWCMMSAFWWQTLLPFLFFIENTKKNCISKGAPGSPREPLGGGALGES